MHTRSAIWPRNPTPASVFIKVKTLIWKDIYPQFFIAALTTIAKIWKQPVSIKDEWVKKMWCMYTMEYLLLFSHPGVSNSLRPRGLQHTRTPCPSPSPEICPSSCSLHRWCCSDISSSNAIFFFCPQSFAASGTFPKSHLVALDDQNTGSSASTSVLPVNIQG